MDAPIPLSLLGVAVVCILAMIAVLLIYFANTVMYGFDSFLPREGILLALFVGVIPMLVLYTVLENLPVSRWLILIELLFGLGALLSWAGKAPLARQEHWVYVGVFLAVPAAIYWLFFSARLHTYYAVLSGKQPLDENTEATIRSPKYRVLIRVVSAYAPYMELVAAILILATLAVALGILPCNCGLDS